VTGRRIEALSAVDASIRRRPSPRCAGTSVVISAAPSCLGFAGHRTAPRTVRASVRCRLSAPHRGMWARKLVVARRVAGGPTARRRELVAEHQTDRPPTDRATVRRLSAPHRGMWARKLVVARRRIECSRGEEASIRRRPSSRADPGAGGPTLRTSLGCGCVVPTRRTHGLATGRAVWVLEVAFWVATAVGGREFRGRVGGAAPDRVFAGGRGLDPTPAVLEGQSGCGWAGLEDVLGRPGRVAGRWGWGLARRRPATLVSDIVSTWTALLWGCGFVSMRTALLWGCDLMTPPSGRLVLGAVWGVSRPAR